MKNDRGSGSFSGWIGLGIVLFIFVMGLIVTLTGRSGLFAP
jgi:hypothetical protein